MLNASISQQSALTLYIVYAVFAVGLVVWLARVLFKNGAAFLEGVFENEQMAAAVNHLLVVGFYLLNLGYALTIYKISSHPDLTAAYNGLISSLGQLLLSLGVIHLINMFIFWRIHSYSGATAAVAPAPTFTAPPPQFATTATASQTMAMPPPPQDRTMPPPPGTIR